MSMATTVARKWPTAVWLSYDELNAVMAVLPEPRRQRSRSLASARRKIDAAWRRRGRAVGRSKR